MAVVERQLRKSGGEFIESFRQIEEGFGLLLAIKETQGFL
jgi:hypothetical protein